MNIRLFIAEVNKRRALWDQSSRSYHNKKALNEGWREVAKIFNIEVMMAKQKWKNLRDTFRVELKKTKRYCGMESSASHSRSSWAYYQDMYFLKDILRTRRSREYLEMPNTSHNKDEVIHTVKIEEEDDTEVKLSPEHLADDADVGENSSNIIIENVTSLHAQSDDVDTTHDIQKKYIKKRRNDDDENEHDDDQDDDLLFFRSLMPFVKRLDQDKKLLFRMNVQQMLYTELYSNNN